MDELDSDLEQSLKDWTDLSHEYADLEDYITNTNQDWRNYCQCKRNVKQESLTNDTD